MGLIVLRCVYIMLTCGAGMCLFGMGKTPWMVPTGLVLLAVVCVIVDMLIPRKSVTWLSSIYIGLLAGTLLTATIGYTLMPLFAWIDNTQISLNVMMFLGILLCYLCISFLVQTRDDIRFIIPYVELRHEVKKDRLLILDASVLIDGRITEVLETLMLDEQLVIPRFVVDEIQNLSGGGERSRRSRGKRGMDALNRLQKMKGNTLCIVDTEMPESRSLSGDLKLVELAKHLGGRLFTNDYNLSKIAKEHKVGVTNLNDLANALKPAFFPGEKLIVELVKPGEETNQGIGYLDDGTMVVIEEGLAYIGEHVVLTVSSILQTSAGRMIFGRYESVVKKGDLPMATPLPGRAFIEKR